MTPLYIVIKTCNRAVALSRLLTDIERAMPKTHRLELAVWDDASELDMAAPRAHTAALGGRWHRRDKRAGKEEAWRHHNDIYAALRHIVPNAPLFFFDDDMRLCDRFFERALSFWECLPADKATLHLMVDAARDGSPCWTGYRAHNLGKHLRRTQWVDGSFMTTRRMLEAIGWTLVPVDPTRWDGKTGRSTGCGEQISQLLHKKGLGMYQVRDSLLVHVEVPSVYHEQTRRSEPLRAQRFVDGPAAAARLARAERTEASLATMPSREHTLGHIVKALLPQVDVLRVYLNGFAAVPAVLRHQRIVIARSQDHGDRGDAGKFFWAEEAKGYQLICDDDLRYPQCYAARHIRAIERYGRKAVVGYHGVLLKRRPVKSYYADRLVTHFSLTVHGDAPMHLLGTGTVAYHPSTLRIRLSDFRHPNMADIWLGRLAQEQKVPMIMLARAARYLTGIVTADQAIFDRYKQCDSRQSEAINDLGQWVLYGEHKKRGPAPAPRSRGPRPRRHA